MEPRFLETAIGVTNSCSHWKAYTYLQKSNNKEQQTLAKEEKELDCQASKQELVRHDCKKRIRTAEEAYTLIKNKAAVANACVLALPLN